jgi:hypothetical protein
MNSNDNKNFVDKPFRVVPGGQYDEFGFYYTPNGSFWDPDGVYFNQEGFDKHGGYYDEHLEYRPGQGWIDELMCYQDEKHEILGSRPNKGGPRNNRRGDYDDMLDEAGDELDDIDELYEEIDYEKLMQEEFRKDQSRHHQEQPHKVHTGRHMIQQNQQAQQIKPNEIKVDYNQKPSQPQKTQPEVKVTPDQLFNKIPPKLEFQITEIGDSDGEEVVRKEKHIEVDSLFK